MCLHYFKSRSNLHFNPNFTHFPNCLDAELSHEFWQSSGSPEERSLNPGSCWPQILPCTSIPSVGTGTDVCSCHDSASLYLVISHSNFRCLKSDKSAQVLSTYIGCFANIWRCAVLQVAFWLAFHWVVLTRICLVQTDHTTLIRSQIR